MSNIVITRDGELLKAFQRGRRGANSWEACTCSYPDYIVQSVCPRLIDLYDERKPDEWDREPRSVKTGTDGGCLLCSLWKGWAERDNEEKRANGMDTCLNTRFSRF
jgi:hypothetical protein